MRHTSAANRAFCADNHLLVHKQVVRGQTKIEVAQLDRQALIEELARMLTGAEITASARRHAKELLKG